MSGAMIGGKTVAGMAFGGVSITGLAKGGVVIWRKPKPEWTDQTDKLFAVANNLAAGLTITKAGAGDYLLTVTSTISDGSIIIGADNIPNLGNLSADWPETGILRATLEPSDIRVNLGGFGLSADGSSFQVETETKAANSAWFGLWARQTIEPGEHHLRIKYETKSA